MLRRSLPATLVLLGACVSAPQSAPPPSNAKNGTSVEPTGDEYTEEITTTGSRMPRVELAQPTGDAAKSPPPPPTTPGPTTNPTQKPPEVEVAHENGRGHKGKAKTEKKPEGKRLVLEAPR